MKPPIPILRSFDEGATKAFYIDFLGFDVTFEHRFEPETPRYMGIGQGDCELYLSEHFGDAAPGAALRIEVEDVRAMAKALNAKKYRHARPSVQRQPWGWDDMTINDPSGKKTDFLHAAFAGLRHLSVDVKQKDSAFPHGQTRFPEKPCLR